MEYNFHKDLVLRTPFYNYNSQFDVNNLSAEVEEAIFIASPDLYNAYKSKAVLRNSDRIRSAINKYCTRMKTRFTPFGLFAGCCVVPWGYANDIILDYNWKRKTFIDTHLQGLIVGYLHKISSIRNKLRYYINNSLYQVGSKLRYVAYNVKNGERKYFINDVDYSIDLKNLIQQIGNGVTLNYLIKFLVKDGFEYAESLDFVNDLVDSQILVSELEMNVTGKDYFKKVLSTIGKLNKNGSTEISYINERLIIMNQLVEKLDRSKINGVKPYEEIFRILDEIGISYEKNNSFHINLIQNVISGSLDKSYQKRLLSAVILLSQVSWENNGTRDLNVFRQNFIKRYEGKEVPLLELMDNELGIGYSLNKQGSGENNPLVNNLVLHNESDSYSIVWNEWIEYLNEKLQTSIQNSESIIKIKDHEISSIKFRDDEMPDTFSIMFRHLGGENLMIDSVGSSSAANLLGRFAMTDKRIHGIVKYIVGHENHLNKGSILAEIIHVPENKIGNVLVRPILRQYEIPYIAKSSVYIDKQIFLKDIVVAIENNEVILKSKKLNKRVIPRLSSAHNFSFKSLPVYQFLCDLQLQGIKGNMSFSWGYLEQIYRYLPRVVYRNVILSPATWRFKNSDFDTLLGVNNHSLMSEVKKFRDFYHLPQLLLIIKGDNELLIDLKIFQSVKLMLDTIRGKDEVKLIEFLFDPETAIVKDVKGNPYTNQFIATLIKEKPVVEVPIKKEVKNYKSKNGNIQRNFSLGSEWLYYKIYCGYKTADRVLTELIKPLNEKLLEQELISNWFFIRYADPDPHLRLRFRLTDKKHIGIVVEKFSKQIAQFETWGLVWKIQTDTYKRELERYGKNSMELAEQLFYYDSVATVNMVDLIEGDAGEVIRWKYCIRAIDELLSKFGYTSESKRDLLDNLKTGFAQEFNMNRDLKKQIDKKFRDNRTAIEDVLDRTNDANSELLPLFEILRQKSEQEKPVVESILKMNEEKQLLLSLNNLLSSFIHMLVNRLFKSKQRVHELVIYDFMYRYYRSSLAKQKNQQKEIMC